MAYGHLPLLHEASLRIESRERVCVIGRNGTGKSTLLQIAGGELAPQERHRLARAGSAHRPAGAGCAVRRRPASVRRCRRGACGHGWRRLARGAASRNGALQTSDPRRRHHGHAVGRLATPCAAGAGAGDGAGSTAARRADQSSRHRNDAVARRLSGRLCRHGPVRDARSRVSPGGGDADRRAGSRPPDVVARRLRDLPPAQGRVARHRRGASRQVRQAACRGGSVAASGHQGAAHAK